MRVYNALILFFFALFPIGGLSIPGRVCHAQTAQLAEGEVSLAIGFTSKIFMNVDPKDAKAIVDLYVKEFGRSLNIETKAVVYSDINSIISDLTTGRLDIVSTLPIEYHRIAQRADTELAYTNTNNDRKKRKWILLVRNNSGIRGLDDLKDKKLTIGKADTIGLMFADILLLRNNKRPAEQYFSKIIKKRKISSIILDLFFKKTDACLVDDWAFSTMAELNPQIQKQLKIISASPAIINTIIFFRKDISKEKKERAREAIRQMTVSDYGQQLLMVIKSDSIVKLELSDLDSFNQFFNEYEKLIRQWNKQMKAQ